MQDTTPTSVAFETAEDTPTNLSANATLGDIIAARLSRRELMSNALAVATITAAVSPMAMLAACGETPENETTPNFWFREVEAAVDDRHHVAAGYDADVLVRWGDKVAADAPTFDPNNQTADAQSKQFGYNNDFVGFLPLDGGKTRGLLCINHEYTNEELMFADLGEQRDAKFAAMTPELIAIEMAAHGGSVIEIARVDGTWQVVEGSAFARRITAETEIRLSGPAAGHALLQTSADPTGTTVRGMVNNCAGAMTPWGTWLTCEENTNGYFWNKGALRQHPEAVALERYGIPGQWYAWGKFHDRFDIAKEPNEPHRFGWVVEIDPLDPKSTPIKRTALGRFKHEGAGNIINRDGRFVVYQGDDQRFDYVYRFVTDGTVDKTNRAANKDILDAGVLYVAKFNADGTGVWLPLQHGHGPLTAASGFADQGAVLVKTRLAADLLGATKMDRPEDVEANPRTGKVYVMLTNNSKRQTAAVDAANPRPENRFGHIIEITPDAGDHTAPTFSWEILVKCGDPNIESVGATFNAATSKDGWFANPDNCAFDADGRLWIATDGNSTADTGRTDGVWAMETQGDARGTSKLFYRCPIGAELCGPAFTPDMETFFVAVQHPGASESDEPGTRQSTFNDPTTRWPDFKSDMPPRPAIVAITRKSGGKIATS